MFVYVSMEPDKKERLQSRFEMRPAGRFIVTSTNQISDLKRNRHETSKLVLINFK